MRKKHLVSLFITLLFLLASTSLSWSSEPTAELAKEGYVGAETCQGCHETQYATYAKSVHAKKHVKGPGSADACETCHGPGAKHVEKGGGRGVDIFAFNKNVDPKAKAAKCLACHDETTTAAFWSQSKHNIKGVSCDNCHSPHSGTKNFLKADRSEVCFQCHKDIQAMTRKQSHHPIMEGKVACVDCHNPHGELADKMLKADSVNELCYKCHAEKRGPFMNEHPPVEENCLNCHNPHGSNHDRLLTQRVPVLCEQCHSSGGHMGGSPFTTFAAGNNSPVKYMVGRGCLNCHQNIHGSSGLLKANGCYFRE